MEEFYNENDDDYEKQKKNSDSVPNVRDVLQSIWIRCVILYGFKNNKFIRNYNLYFLPIISIIIWCVFLFIEN